MAIWLQQKCCKNDWPYFISLEIMLQTESKELWFNRWTTIADSFNFISTPRNLVTFQWCINERASIQVLVQD